MVFNKLFDDYSNNNIGGLTDELKCIYIANNFKENTLVVCNSLYEANKFYQTLKNYVDNVYFFPMDDFMTSQVLAISPDFKMTRLETLNNIDDKCIVVTNLMGYLRFLPPKDVFKKNFIKLKVNDDIKDLDHKLYDIGYENETIVTETGKIGVRGYVLDVFPLNSELPYRIHFFDTQIEKITTFNILTQFKIDEVNEIVVCPNGFLLAETAIKEALEYIDSQNNKMRKNAGKRADFSDYIANLDALTHAIESLITKNATQFSDMFAIESIKTIAKYLHTAYIEPNNVEAREKMAFAQYVVGMGFSNVGLGIVHSMAHPLGGQFDVPHGVANAMLLPTVMRYNINSPSKPKFRLIAEAFGVNTQGLNDDEAADLAVELVENLRSKLNIPQSLSELGITEKDLDSLSVDAYNDICTGGNPRDTSVADIKKLYAEIL